MSLRLNTGFCKGLVLNSPASVTRPTAGRVRAAIWNSLQNELRGARVLDLCAGSGAVGIEALSRGAAAATFIESDKKAFQALESNLDEVKRRASRAGLSLTIEARWNAVEQHIKQLKDDHYTIVWIDAPFELTQELVGKLAADIARVLHKPAGLWVIESNQADLAAIAQCVATPAFTLLRQKSYGKIGVTFVGLSEEAVVCKE